LKAQLQHFGELLTIDFTFAGEPFVAACRKILQALLSANLRIGLGLDLLSTAKRLDQVVSGPVPVAGKLNLSPAAATSRQPAQYRC
jgi:hypothetical protein